MYVYILLLVLSFAAALFFNLQCHWISFRSQVVTCTRVPVADSSLKTEFGKIGYVHHCRWYMATACASSCPVLVNLTQKTYMYSLYMYHLTNFMLSIHKTMILLTISSLHLFYCYPTTTFSNRCSPQWSHLLNSFSLKQQKVSDKNL